eukprot:37557-Prorocentrum_minimum.AAC.1
MNCPSEKLFESFFPLWGREGSAPSGTMHCPSEKLLEMFLPLWGGEGSMVGSSQNFTRRAGEKLPDCPDC